LFWDSNEPENSQCRKFYAENVYLICGCSKYQARARMCRFL